MPVTIPVRAASSWKTIRAIGREHQHPEEPVAVVGAQDRVGGDPRGVVVRQPREQSRPEDREHPQRAEGAAAPAEAV